MKKLLIKYGCKYAFKYGFELLALMTAFGCGGYYYEARSAELEKPKTEQQYKPTTVKKKTVYTRTVTESVEEVASVE